MHRIAKKKSSAWKMAAWMGGGLVVLVVAGLLAAQAWVGRYLRSVEFREKVEEESGRALRAKVELARPQLEDSQFYTERFEAQGTQEAGFAKLTAENIRGDYRLPSLLKLILGERKAVLDNVEVQRIEVDVSTDSRLELNLPPPSTEPRKVDVLKARVRELRMKWDGGGGMTGVAVRTTEVEGGWKLEGDGGELRVPISIPAFQLTSARAVYKEAEKVLFIQDAKARIGGGDVQATGEFNPKTLADLQLEVNDVDAAEVLPPDWRARLHGKINGEARLKLPIGRGGGDRLVLTGKVSLKQGVLEALPVLQKIAEYTKTDGIRHLSLDKLTGDFEYDRGVRTVKVTNMVLDNQYLRVKGSFTVKDDQLDGMLSLGLSPGALRWIPGAQEKVFTEQREGFVWAPVRLAGTTSAPREDLSSRLVVAAGEAVVETVQDTATEAAGTVLQTGKNAAKKAANGVFDLLFGGQ